MGKPTSEIQCPSCGYYCLGKGGFGCIDKPTLFAMEQSPATTTDTAGAAQDSSQGDAELRLKIHMEMLSKSESAKDLRELTVVPLGFAVDVAMELVQTEVKAAMLRQRAYDQRLIDAEVRQELEKVSKLQNEGGTDLDKSYKSRVYVSDRIAELEAGSGEGGK